MPLALLASWLLTYLVTYFTLSVQGCRGKVKLSISRKSEGYNEGDGVYPHAVFDALQQILICFVHGSVFDSFNNLFWWEWSRKCSWSCDMSLWEQVGRCVLFIENHNGASAFVDRHQTFWGTICLPCLYPIQSKMLSLSRAGGRILSMNKRLWGKCVRNHFMSFNYIFFRVKDIGKIWQRLKSVNSCRLLANNYIGCCLYSAAGYWFSLIDSS